MAPRIHDNLTSRTGSIEYAIQNPSIPQFQGLQPSSDHPPHSSREHLAYAMAYHHRL
jgi:hypothetical protein